MIWEPYPRSLRISAAFAAGLARLVAKTRFNFDTLGPFRLTPGVSAKVPAVSRSSTFTRAAAPAPSLTRTDTPPNALGSLAGAQHGRHPKPFASDGHDRQ